MVGLGARRRNLATDLLSDSPCELIVDLVETRNGVDEDCRIVTVGKLEADGVDDMLLLVVSQRVVEELRLA